MKLLLIILTILFIALVGSILSASPSDWIDVSFTLPAQCSAINGEIVVHNCAIEFIRETYRNKKVESYGNHFLIYSLNQKKLGTGVLVVRVRPVASGVTTVGLANLVGATPDAKPVTVLIYPPAEVLA